jgi:hypothetical protein
VKVVQSQLRHKNPTETLNVYAHLFADDDSLTRKAVDAELGPRVSGAGPAADISLADEASDQ